MRNWAWLLPCWVWKYFFAQFPRERVLVDGRPRFLIRLDEEFALVYDPQGQAMLPQSLSGENENTPATEPARIFAPSKNRALYPGQSGESKFVRTRSLRGEFHVGTQSD